MSPEACKLSIGVAMLILVAVLGVFLWSLTE